MNNIQRSNSAPGSPLDNSVAESFFHTFKKEFPIYTKSLTINNIQDYIEAIDSYIDFYNNDRIGKRSNNLPPKKHRENYFKNVA